MALCRSSSRSSRPEPRTADPAPRLAAAGREAAGALAAGHARAAASTAV